jgi:hypothetical protein
LFRRNKQHWIRIWNRYGTMLIIKSSLCLFDNKMSSITKLMAKSFESPDEEPLKKARLKL